MLTQLNQECRRAEMLKLVSRGKPLLWVFHTQVLLTNPEGWKVNQGFWKTRWPKTDTLSNLHNLARVIILSYPDKRTNGQYDNMISGKYRMRNDRFLDVPDFILHLYHSLSQPTWKRGGRRRERERRRKGGKEKGTHCFEDVFNLRPDKEA